jgi:DNA-binding MarR family transcriptional regulator
MTITGELAEPSVQETAQSIKPQYLAAVTLIERLSRHLVDVRREEFDRQSRAELNPVQALLLYNIGDQDLAVGELRTRGYYLGSNISHNLKKLANLGLLQYRRSCVDQRSVRLRLTDQGREIRDIIAGLYEKHVHTVERAGGISSDELATLNRSLHRLDQFWTSQIRYRL